MNSFSFLSGSGPGARVLDVGDNTAVRVLMVEFSRLDGLVNCAGTILRGGAGYDPEDFATVAVRYGGLHHREARGGLDVFEPPGSGADYGERFIR